MATATARSLEDFTPTLEAYAPTVHRIDPRTDDRWARFVEAHPHASVFHSPPFLQALYRTYGYESFVWTTTPPGQPLRNGIVFCEVKSWLTGRRLVSVPFADHCEPLVDSQDDLQAIALAMEEAVWHKHWRYVELRPLESLNLATGLGRREVKFSLHVLDLQPTLPEIYRRFHHDSIQRKIRRAERERLRYEEGRSDALLDEFYRLIKMTRARHRLPAQPRRWFRNLMECFGEALKIRVAYKEDLAVAAMITLKYKDTLVYKYGGSDREYNRTGGMHLLYWRSIQDAKNLGLRYLDLGRTDAGQDGLVIFKNRWGATCSTLTYSRYAPSEDSTHVFDLAGANWKARMAKKLLGGLNPSTLSFLGRILYKHVG